MSTTIRRNSHGRKTTPANIESVLTRVLKLADSMRSAKLASQSEQARADVPELLRGLDDSERSVVAGFVCKKHLGCGYSPDAIESWCKELQEMKPGEWRW